MSMLRHTWNNLRSSDEILLHLHHCLFHLCVYCRCLIFLGFMCLISLSSLTSMQFVGEFVLRVNVTVLDVWILDPVEFSHGTADTQPKFLCLSCWKYHDHHSLRSKLRTRTSSCPQIPLWDTLWHTSCERATGFRLPVFPDPRFGKVCWRLLAGRICHAWDVTVSSSGAGSGCRTCSIA